MCDTSYEEKNWDESVEYGVKLISIEKTKTVDLIDQIIQELN